jgi:hypothetical protein
VPEQPAPIFIGALTPGIKQKATSVQLSNPSYGLLESGKVGRQKKNRGRLERFPKCKKLLLMVLNANFYNAGVITHDRRIGSWFVSHQ